jgi:predicted GNAT family acetyltransferase
LFDLGVPDAMSTVEITREDEGRYTAVHTTTGASAEGETEAGALEALAERLRTTGTDDPQATFERVSGRIQERVRKQGAEADIVEDAIERARSR